MNVLNQLTEDQKTLLVSLPYRAGYWISYSDQTGGAESQAAELRVLDNIIHGFAHEVFGSEMVQHIMVETLARKDDWPRWAAGIDTIYDDCKKAVDILGAHVDDKDIKAFAARLMEISEAVALAFCEQDYEAETLLDKTRLRFSAVVERFKPKPNHREIRSLKQFANISKDERAALMGLAKALGAAYN